MQVYIVQVSIVQVGQVIVQIYIVLVSIAQVWQVILQVTVQVYYIVQVFTLCTMQANIVQVHFVQIIAQVICKSVTLCKSLIRHKASG